jgi:hypothetical protein
MLDTSAQERDYFNVTLKPSVERGNQMMVFEDSGSGQLEASMFTDFASQSLATDADDTKRMSQELIVSRPSTAVDEDRPKTSASEVYEHAKKKASLQAGEAARPSTSTGVRSFRQNVDKAQRSEHQIWADAARLSAMVGGKDPVDGIKRFFDSVRPRSSSAHLPDGATCEPTRLSSRGVINTEKKLKPGALPRGISAEQARQFVSKKWQASDGTKRDQNLVAEHKGRAAHESLSKQHPAASLQQAKKEQSSDLPGGAAGSGLKATSRPNESNLRSSLFLTASDKQARSAAAKEASAQKTSIGIERSRSDRARHS